MQPSKCSQSMKASILNRVGRKTHAAAPVLKSYRWTFLWHLRYKQKLNSPMLPLIGNHYKWLVSVKAISVDVEIYSFDK